MLDPYLVRRLDHPLLGDIYLATLLASGAVFALAGWGVLMGLLCGIVLGLPAIALTSRLHRRLAGADPRGLRARLLACLALAGLVAGLDFAWVGAPGLLIGAALFAATAARVVARDRSVFKDRPLPAAQDAQAAPNAADAPGPPIAPTRDAP